MKNRKEIWNLAKKCKENRISFKALNRTRALKIIIIIIRELKHETFLSTQTSNSQGETGSTPAYVFLYFCNFLSYIFFFGKWQEICFSNATFKDCFQLMSILFCLLEIKNLITIILSWLTWIINYYSSLPQCKNLWYFFFVSLARAGVWLLFNGLLALLFSFFHVICEFDRFLHQERADNSECKANFILKTWSARVIWGSASPHPWKILLISETKRKLQRCTGI